MRNVPVPCPPAPAGPNYVATLRDTPTKPSRQTSEWSTPRSCSEARKLSGSLSVASWPEAGPRWPPRCRAGDGAVCKGGAGVGPAHGAL